MIGVTPVIMCTTPDSPRRARPARAKVVILFLVYVALVAGCGTVVRPPADNRWHSLVSVQIPGEMFTVRLVNTTIPDDGTKRAPNSTPSIPRSRLIGVAAARSRVACGR